MINWKILGVTILLGVVLIGLILIGKKTFNNRSNITIDTSRTAVIKQIQKLQRLETASYTIDKIIEGGTNGNTFNTLLYGDRILLIAHGTVIAGFDLANMNETGITVNDKELEISLPAPEIFSSKLDAEQTHVYDRKLGLLTKGDKDLETKVRAAAETSIRTAACQDGILTKASQNGINQLTSLFTSVGFTKVTITAEEGTCQ